MSSSAEVAVDMVTFVIDAVSLVVLLKNRKIFYSKFFTFFMWSIFVDALLIFYSSFLFVLPKFVPNFMNELFATFDKAFVWYCYWSSIFGVVNMSFNRFTAIFLPLMHKKVLRSFSLYSKTVSGRFQWNFWIRKLKFEVFSVLVPLIACACTENIGVECHGTGNQLITFEADCSVFWSPKFNGSENFFSFRFGKPEIWQCIWFYCN